MVNTTHETGVEFDGDRLTNKHSLCLVSLALLPVEQGVIMDGGGQVCLSLLRPSNVCNTIMVDRDWWITWLDLCRFDDGRYIFAIHTKCTTDSKSLGRQVFEDCRRCVIIVEVDVAASVYAWLNHAHYNGISDSAT